MKLLLTFLVLALLSACAGTTLQPGAKVTGTATYRERIALPPNAVFEATLEEVSKADARAEMLGRARIEGPGNPPIAFEIPYDASRIEPRRRYTVRARITVGDQLMFVTDQHHPVLGAEQGSRVELLLRRAAESRAPSDEPAPLENTYWKLVELGGAPVQAAERQREAHFVLHRVDRRVAGAGGCNLLTGRYELDGDRLSFGKMATTMMACAQGMEAEKAFLAALQRAVRPRITGQRLDLLDAGGNVLARFDAVYLR